MQVTLTDTLLLNEASVRITRDGYMVANARSARTGIQEYRAYELGLEDRDPNDVIRVYRPEEEVFAEDALASMAYRPMTNEHPSENVTADNWKKLSVGTSGGEIVRDGEFVRVPLVRSAGKHPTTSSGAPPMADRIRIDVRDGVAESDEQLALIGSANQVEAVKANLEQRAPRFV